MPVAIQITPGTRKAPRQEKTAVKRRGDAGGERDAEIAAHAVERHGAAALRRVFDDHGGADRMIDRGEHAEREQGDREHGKRRREGGADQREAAADIKDRQKVAAAPAVAEPARRQREQAEGDEGRGRERDQRRIGFAVNRPERDHHRRIDQNDVVVDGVGPVEKADGEPALGQCRRSLGRQGFEWQGFRRQRSDSVVVEMVIAVFPGAFADRIAGRSPPTYPILAEQVGPNQLPRFGAGRTVGIRLSAFEYRHSSVRGSHAASRGAYSWS